MINLRIHTSVLSYYIFLTFNILSVQPDIKLQSAGSCSSSAHTHLPADVVSSSQIMIIHGASCPPNIMYEVIP